VKELAADGIPVVVTCRALKLARQPYYRWLANPMTDAEYLEAHRANALFDAHRDDPEFGYRYLVEEARDGGTPMAERTAWRPKASSACTRRTPYVPREAMWTALICSVNQA
jgi:putative transposase